MGFKMRAACCSGSSGIVGSDPHLALVKVLAHSLFSLEGLHFLQHGLLCVSGLPTNI